VIAGRYRLTKALGHGGMSEVWGAEDAELGRLVAIKLLGRDADRLRFEREARAVASLGHPNIMQVYDFGEVEGRPYMVLEYLPGGTLEDRLDDGKPLPDEQTFGIAAGIAAGLAHAHARGVVHRDLKPSNVLFDDEGRPKLADFGIARLSAGEGTLTEAGTVLGTAAYISPEQATGEPASAASDVYSFGVILYRMLTGRLPFESDDPMQLVMLHRDAAPPPIDEVRPDAPARLEATAMAALAKAPAERPPDGAALLADLGVPAGTGLTTTAPIAAGDATQVLPVAAAPAVGATAAEAYPAPPPQRSRLPLIVAVLLVLALAGAALAYALTRSTGSSSPPATIPAVSVKKKHHRPHTTTQATTAPSTTAPTTAQQTTTAQTTTHRATTTAPPPPTTTVAPPPTTTAPPPTTTAPPPTTTEPPTTTIPAVTTR